MKKYWKLIAGSILFPTALLLGYFYVFLFATFNFIIEFEWKFTEIRKNFNLPLFSELWDDFKEYLDELKGK